MKRVPDAFTNDVTWLDNPQSLTASDVFTDGQGGYNGLPNHSLMSDDNMSFDSIFTARDPSVPVYNADTSNLAERLQALGPHDIKQDMFQSIQNAMVDSSPARDTTPIYAANTAGLKDRLEALGGGRDATHDVAKAFASAMNDTPDKTSSPSNTKDNTQGTGYHNRITSEDYSREPNRSSSMQSPTPFRGYTPDKNPYLGDVSDTFDTVFTKNSPAPQRNFNDPFASTPNEMNAFFNGDSYQREDPTVPPIDKLLDAVTPARSHTPLMDDPFASRRSKTPIKDPFAVDVEQLYGHQKHFSSPDINSVSPNPPHRKQLSNPEYGEFRASKSPTFLGDSSVFMTSKSPSRVSPYKQRQKPLTVNNQISHHNLQSKIESPSLGGTFADDKKTQSEEKDSFDPDNPFGLDDDDEDDVFAPKQSSNPPEQYEQPPRKQSHDQYQPPRKQSYDQYQPPRKQSYDQYQPPRKQSYDQHQPPRKQSYDQYQPPRKQSYDQYQPPRKQSYDQYQPPSNQTPRKQSYDQYQPPNNQTPRNQYQPPVRKQSYDQYQPPPQKSDPLGTPPRKHNPQTSKYDPFSVNDPLNSYLGSDYLTSPKKKENPGFALDRYRENQQDYFTNSDDVFPPPSQSPPQQRHTINDAASVFTTDSVFTTKDKVRQNPQFQANPYTQDPVQTNGYPDMSSPVGNIPHRSFQPPESIPINTASSPTTSVPYQQTPNLHLTPHYAPPHFEIHVHTPPSSARHAATPWSPIYINTTTSYPRLTTTLANTQRKNSISDVSTTAFAFGSKPRLSAPIWFTNLSMEDKSHILKDLISLLKRHGKMNNSVYLVMRQKYGLEPVQVRELYNYSSKRKKDVQEKQGFQLVDDMYANDRMNDIYNGDVFPDERPDNGNAQKRLEELVGSHRRLSLAVYEQMKSEFGLNVAEVRQMYDHSNSPSESSADPPADPSQPSWMLQYDYDTKRQLLLYFLQKVFEHGSLTPDLYRNMANEWGLTKKQVNELHAYSKVKKEADDPLTNMDTNSPISPIWRRFQKRTSDLGKSESPAAKKKKSNEPLIAKTDNPIRTIDFQWEPNSLNELMQKGFLATEDINVGFLATDDNNVCCMSIVHQEDEENPENSSYNIVLTFDKLPASFLETRVFITSGNNRPLLRKGELVHRIGDFGVSPGEDCSLVLLQVLKTDPEWDALTKSLEKQDLVFNIDLDFENAGQTEVIFGQPSLPNTVLRRLWQNRVYSDVTVVCQGERIPCHSSVLSCSSAKLAQQFEQNHESRQSEIRIEEAPPEIVREFIKFMYHGEITQDELIRPLLQLGYSYSAITLMEYCLRHLKSLPSQVALAYRRGRGLTS